MQCPKCQGKGVTTYINTTRLRITGSMVDSWDIDTCGRCNGYGVVDSLTEYEQKVQRMMKDLELEKED